RAPHPPRERKADVHGEGPLPGRRADDHPQASSLLTSRADCGRAPRKKRGAAMKVAVLTGGGDCPGLNAVIRAVVRRGEQHGLEVMGVREGWRGLLDPPLHDRLTREATSGILHLGGTILGTSRTNPFKKQGGAEAVIRNIKALNLGAVVAIGGEDTLGVATKLHQMGMPIVGVPKTIDNDLAGTDLTFGFDTAVQIATEAIDRLHSTAESHNRVIVCE